MSGEGPLPQEFFLEITVTDIAQNKGDWDFGIYGSYRNFYYNFFCQIEGRTAATSWKYGNFFHSVPYKPINNTLNRVHKYYCDADVSGCLL